MKHDRNLPLLPRIPLFLSMIFLGAVTLSVGAKTVAPPSGGVVFRFEATEQPIFPTSLMANGPEEGSVSFLVVVNREGQLDDYLLTEATHRLFGEAVAAVLPRWKYAPPLINGVAVNAVGRVDVNFRRSGSVISLVGERVPNDMFLTPEAKGLRRSAYRIATLRELDRLPEPVHLVEPVLPGPEIVGPVEKIVVFRFYIDETGGVRIPLAAEAREAGVDERVLDAIHSALIQWRFSPPLVGGSPVVVRAAQPFRIGPVNTGSPASD